MDAACWTAVAGKYRQANKGFLITFDPSKVKNSQYKSNLFVHR
ncbi:hypothetical protein L313_0214 [Acinetobacter haemolyticus CIP 64.3 = MTCC 9819]|nr:hypothetical protein L313_0214 [Acinetobacter haemolyticus CIP 64.3 = MTCC 9819]